jgi:phosphatidylglycerol:prolipoprotein diacylglycerol transferase
MGFYIGGFKIYYYGITIALAMLAAILIVIWFCKKRGYNENVPYELFFIVVPFALIGARLYFIIFYESISLADFFDFRGGGMAIYGGVIFGAAAVFVYSRIKKCGFLPVADMIAPGLILAQSIGRWGNYFNQEAHGYKVDWNFFPLTVYIDNGRQGEEVGYYLATFFYESILNLLGFILLYRIFFHQRKHGTTTAWYLIWYGVVRAVVEPLRTDSLHILANDDFILNRVSFLVSIAIVVLGVLILFLNKKGVLSQNEGRLYCKSVK